MHTILNAMLLACAESSIGSMQIGFLMALAGVPVRELFIYFWILAENEGPSCSSTG